MKPSRLPFFLFFLLLTNFIQAQTAAVRGIVFDPDNNPLDSVNVLVDGGGTQTDLSGFYYLEIPANQDVVITFTHVGHQQVQVTVNLDRNEDYEFNPQLQIDVEQITEVVITGRENKQVQGVTTISPATVRRIPGANAGVENLIKSLPGVGGNDELSTQYTVRGGNFDENLLYVNEIEVYRPFLIRSGQQEGLSFVNTDLTSSVDFSAGGFQAKYGDRLSSVLDITYKKPTEFEASADLSFLGASVSAGSISKDGRFSGMVGLRYRDNSLFVNAKQTETNFRPRFADAQAYLRYSWVEAN